MEESSTSVVVDKHPVGCSPVGDRATKMSLFTMQLLAVNIYQHNDAKYGGQCLGGN